MVVGACAAYPRGATGGAAEVALTEAQMPAHSHAASLAADGSHTHNVGCDKDAAYSTASSSGFSVHLPGGRSGGSTMSGHGYYGSTGAAGSHSHAATVSAAGGGEAHPNMQPYGTASYIVYAGR